MDEEIFHVSDPWYLYLIECRSGAYYAGITNNLEARYQAHVSGKGARYTRANPPVRLLGYAAFPNRSSASRAEWAIKQMPRDEKIPFLLDSGGTTYPPAPSPPARDSVIDGL